MNPTAPKPNSGLQIARRYLVIGLLVALPRAAQPGLALVAGVQQACYADFAKFCSPARADSNSSRPDSPVQPSCLRKYWVSLSSQCRKALAPSSGDQGADDSQD
jgi:hypothetical protein